jgi:hypothetical protein
VEEDAVTKPRLIYRACLRGPEAVAHIINLSAARMVGLHETEIGFCTVTGLTFATQRIGAATQRVTRADMRSPPWALVVDHQVRAHA